MALPTPKFRTRSFIFDLGGELNELDFESLRFS